MGARKVNKKPPQQEAPSTPLTIEEQLALAAKREAIRRDNIDRIAPWQFKKGQSGNPGGRPPGKSLKERAKIMLLSMNEEEEQAFFHGLDKRTVWEMAEGKPAQDMRVSAAITISSVLDEIEHGQPISAEVVENVPSLPDTGQGEPVNKVPAEPSAGALQLEPPQP